MTAQDLGSRTFTLDDQLSFARMSGDFNPIHVDPLYARRSPLGVVVHGVHLVLWLMEQWAKDQAPLSEIERVSVVFLKAVALQEPVVASVEVEGEKWRVNAKQGGVPVASIVCQRGPKTGGESVVDNLPADPGSPLAKTFQSLENEVGTLRVLGDDSLLRKSFPQLAAQWGTARIAALAALSRLVGMIAPGQNSLFSGIDVKFEAYQADRIEYRIGKLRSPKIPFKIAVEGAGLKGELSAFYRPEPVKQISFLAARELVSHEEFAGVRALVVGGSRGIGEVAAKLLAAGGAEVTVTYQSGRADAEALCQEIAASGGVCRSESYNVLASDARVPKGPFNQVYYFATPTIRVNTSGEFNDRLYKDFCAFYREGFLRLARGLGSESCRIFYPSTTYVEEQPKGFEEYVRSKQEGERDAAELGRTHSQLRVEVVRFPRVNTDQTNTMTGSKSDDPAPILLEFIRQRM